MPMFPPQGPPAAAPPIPMPMGLLPNPNDPRTRPLMGPLARAFGMGGGNRGRSENPGYTPQEVLRSQQSLADWFQSRPAAAGTAAGNIGTVGNAFMGTYLPTRAEERMRENERISADTARRAGSATTLEEAIAALAGGDPQQRNLATAQRLEALDPLRRAQVAQADVQTRTAQRELEFQDQIFGPGGQQPPQAPAAGPQGGDGFRWPDTTGVRPSPEMSEGQVVQPPPAPPPGRMNLGGPMPQPEGGENMVLPAQALMDQSIQAAQSGQPAAQAATPPPITQDVLSVLGTRPLIERRAWYNLYKKEPSKAMTQLEEWGDPQAARNRVVTREAAEAEGKLVGQSRANLPMALQSGESITRNIDEVLGNSRLPSVTGPLQGRLPTIRGESADLEARIGQLQGQAFLQAFQSLRGGGTITEAEGAKASAAIARLQNLAQSDQGYVQALNDARKEIHDLMNIARQKAGQRPVPYTPYNAPNAAGTPDADGWVTMPGNVRIRKLP